MPDIQLLGLDCATTDRRIGLARGSFSDGKLRLDEAMQCTGEESASEVIVRWLSLDSLPALLAIDAPLGWPAGLSTALSSHRAGEEVTLKPNEMFRRETDRFIRREFGKTPLDVGADRIARTAHAALRILGELRRTLAEPIPLAWSPPLIDSIQAIEVYPAVTLLAHGIRSGGYKAPDQRGQRQEIIDRLEELMELPANTEPVLASADALDAAVCLLAAADFLTDSALPPEDSELARREGWIWARRQNREMS